jgi:hypothetical protein
MIVQLFGVGTKSRSPMITAQKRINCFVEMRREQEKTSFALVGRPGLTAFVSNLGALTTRGKWAVNTLTAPLDFIVQGNQLLSVNNGGVSALIGTLNTSTGNVSMADDGTYLVIVDGTNGYVYNMLVPLFMQITDGNFTTTPGTVTWQDNYFAVMSNATRQWQLSQISPSINPLVWPSVQIGFTGAGAGALANGISDHNFLTLFGDVYTEFWQNTGSPGLPFAITAGAAQQFGLKAPFSLTKFDNSLVGLFQDRQGGLNISRLNGFSLQQISDTDIDFVLNNFANVADGQGFSFVLDGHPFYALYLPSANYTLIYDGNSHVWSQWTATDYSAWWPNKFAAFVNNLIVSDRRNGNLYKIDQNNYSDNGSTIPMEVWSKHIWNMDKFIGIQWLQVDIESGVGLATGQGSKPVADLQVSKDGGQTFNSVGNASMGKIGTYTTRLKWSTLGAARDWILKLCISDPVKRIITGATAEIIGGSF